jgi:hypothetical protein
MAARRAYGTALSEGFRSCPVWPLGAGRIIAQDSCCINGIENRFAFTAKGLLLMGCAGLWNSVRNHQRVGQCPRLIFPLQWK